VTGCAASSDLTKPAASCTQPAMASLGALGSLLRGSLQMSQEWMQARFLQVHPWRRFDWRVWLSFAPRLPLCERKVKGNRCDTHAILQLCFHDSPGSSNCMIHNQVDGQSDYINVETRRLLSMQSSQPLLTISSRQAVSWPESRCYADSANLLRPAHEPPAPSSDQHQHAVSSTCIQRYAQSSQVRWKNVWLQTSMQLLCVLAIVG
jgi:hypothetical protein